MRPWFRWTLMGLIVTAVALLGVALSPKHDQYDFLRALHPVERVLPKEVLLPGDPKYERRFDFFHPLREVLRVIGKHARVIGAGTQTFSRGDVEHPDTVTSKDYLVQLPNGESGVLQEAASDPDSPAGSTCYLRFSKR